MISKEILIGQIGKAAVIGTAIVFFTNIICHGIGVLTARKSGLSDLATIVTVVLGIAAIADVVVAFILKRKFLAPLFVPNNNLRENELVQTIMKTTIVVSALCALPPVYGLAAVLLGATTEIMVAFSIVSLGGFLILRLRSGDFDRLNEI